MTPMIWTNIRCDNETVYPTKTMEQIVGTEKIQRLSSLEVNIYNKDDFSRPVASMTSTRGE